MVYEVEYFDTEGKTRVVLCSAKIPEGSTDMVRRAILAVQINGGTQRKQHGIGAIKKVIERADLS